MRRKSKRQQEQDRILERLAAEDRAVDYLCTNFARETAAVIATRVECSLAEKWEAEQEEMRWRRDPRKVFQISKEEVQEVRSAFSKIALATTNSEAEQRVYELLKNFHSDEAWFIVKKAARYLRYRVH
jgi:hypothetical protein